jgi:hypothetical protein
LWKRKINMNSILLFFEDTMWLILKTVQKSHQNFCSGFLSLALVDSKRTDLIFRTKKNIRLGSGDTIPLWFGWLMQNQFVVYTEATALLSHIHSNIPPSSSFHELIHAGRQIIIYFHTLAIKAFALVSIFSFFCKGAIFLWLPPSHVQDKQINKHHVCTNNAPNVNSSQLSGI